MCEKKLAYKLLPTYKSSRFLAASLSTPSNEIHFKIYEIKLSRLKIHQDGVQKHDDPLGAVYTMDHEVVPRKRPILRGTTSWDDFHGPSY
jgi:hypothetical protein